MSVAFEDMILESGATVEELNEALDRRNAEVKRVLTGIANDSIILEIADDEE